MKLSKVRRWVVELEERLSLIPEKVFSSSWFILAPQTWASRAHMFAFQ